MAPSYAIPRMASRKWKQIKLGIKDELYKNNQDDADWIIMTNSEMTVRAVCSVLHVASTPH